VQRIDPWCSIPIARRAVSVPVSSLSHESKNCFLFLDREQTFHWLLLTGTTATRQSETAPVKFVSILALVLIIVVVLGLMLII